MYEVYIEPTGQLWAVYATRKSADALMKQLVSWGYRAKVQRRSA